MTSPVLYVFAGLPGTGKSTLAQKLSSVINAVYLRIDTIEDVLRDEFQVNVEAEGYCTAYRIAADNLRLGLSVVADSCNTIELSRQAWLDVAQQQNATALNIEIICTDKEEHRCRLETRYCAAANLAQPSWEQVSTREYQAWTQARIVVDTAGVSAEESFSQLRTRLPGPG